jgi:pyruvate dehydrogenase (quinone)
MANTVAERLVERLIDWGVDTVFGLPGDGINGIFEALRSHEEQIRFVQVRHEEAAAFAACGYAKFSGRPGVCLATSGPGGIHLLNGLYDAKLDGQPVLAITGHTFHDLIGTHYQQDVDLDKLFGDVAEYNERVMGPSHVVNVVDAAMKTALTRRSVAHINIPKDIQDMSSSERSPANIANHSASVGVPSHPLPTGEELARAADLLNAGEKIAILVGRGALHARDEIVELAARLGAPIVKALLGKAVVPDDSPYTTGGIGLLGTPPSAEVLKTCDTLVIVGSSFPYIEFYPDPGDAKVVQIDLDPARIGIRQPVDAALVGDSRAVVRALLELVSQHDTEFLESAQEKMRDWNELLSTRGTRMDRPLKPQVVAYELDKILADDSIVCSDTGTVTTWAARYIRMRGTMEFAASGTLASMANGLPYCVGAAFAKPGRPIVCLSGDGGFTMLMGELATIVKYALPIKIVVFKNNTFGMIKWEQMVMEGNPEYGNDLQPIDFAMFARACGAAGYSVENPEEVASVLTRAFEHNGPALVEATIDPNEPPMPGMITTTQALHFAEALVRGEKDRWEIIKTVTKNTIREVI